MCQAANKACQRSKWDKGKASRRKKTQVVDFPEREEERKGNINRIGEVLDVQNRHMVKDLPHPCVFMLLPCKSKHCPHPKCLHNGNSDDGNTWFPGDPPLNYFPIPVVDPKHPWGGPCEQCGDKCADHNLRLEQHYDYYNAHGRQGIKIKPPSVVTAEAQKNAEREGFSLSGEEKLSLANETL